jgi:hypothetical protein
LARNTRFSGGVHVRGAASPDRHQLELGIFPGHGRRWRRDAPVMNENRVELDYWALSGWMALGAMVSLILIVSISAAFPHLFLR